MSEKSKLTIGYVLDDSIDSTDGVQQYVKTVAGWMESQGHEVHFIVGHSKQDTDNIHSLSKIVKLPFNKNMVATPLPARKKQIKQLLKQYNFDVLHVQMPYSPLLAGKVISSASPSTAIVGTFHILPFSKVHHGANALLAKTLRTTLPKFDHILSVSSAAQAFAKSTYGINSDVIPNAVDARKFMTKRALKHDKNCARIVFLGRLVERKGVQQLLTALARLQANHPKVASQIECYIGGGGKLETQLKTYAKQHNLDHMVHFLGFVPEEEKATLLASADIAVFPALGGESFGIVLIEAMAAGARVVIGGDNPGYRSVLGEKPELLVDPRDTKAFSDKLLQMLTDNSLRDTVYRWQQRTVRQYDVAQVGPKLLSCYQAVISQKNGDKSK